MPQRFHPLPKLRKAARYATGLLCLLSVLVLEGHTFAATPLTNDQRLKYARQGIAYLDDPCSATVATTTDPGGNIIVQPPSSGPPTSVTQATSDLYKKLAFGYFVSKGLTQIQSAGLLGNLDAESSVIPTRLQNHHVDYIQLTPVPGTGWGIAQWTSGNTGDASPSGRQKDLVDFANKAPYVQNGIVSYRVYDLQVQLDFVWHELNTGYKSDLDSLKKATNTQDATNAIMQHYESPAVKDQTALAGRTALSDQILKQYGGIASGSGAAVSTGGCGGGVAGGTFSGVQGYNNPLRDINKANRNRPGPRPERIDEGVDYGGSGPVYAVGPGVLTLSTRSSGWPDNNFIMYKLTAGPAAGKYIYFAEDCIPQLTVSKDPSHPTLVDSNTIICDMYNGQYTIETGWGRSPGDLDLAAAHNVYVEGHATAYGINFSQFMVALGAPAGDISQSKMPVNGTLPAGWPSWK